MNGIWHFILPEWRKLDQIEKKRALQASSQTIGWKRWIPTLMTLPYVAAILLIRPRYTNGWIYAGFLVPPLLTLLIHRNALQHACWMILSARGEKICSACGYDLTGNVSGTCPECGTTVVLEKSPHQAPSPADLVKTQTE